MNKYNIEGGIDFFAELYKSLDNEESKEKTEEDNNKCLISNQLLTDKHVTMKCGHKFNYVPLYYDILNHKNKFNHMESLRGKLNANQIRCPYCRKKQQGNLIYYEELGLQKVHGVNYYDLDLNGSSHSNNLHCYTHKTETAEQHKKQQKETEENKQSTMLEEDMNIFEFQTAKPAPKLKLKAKKKPMPENVVLGLSIVETQNKCTQILKSGANKGKPCGCKIVLENMCKRHYKLNHKDLIIHN
jgi:hypothetical protein